MEPYYKIKISLIDCSAKSYFWWNLFQFTWQLSNHAGMMAGHCWHKNKIQDFRARSASCLECQHHQLSPTDPHKRNLPISSNRTQLSMNDFSCKRTIFGIGTRALKSQVNNFKTFFNLKTKSASHNILCLRAISCSGQAFSRLSF